MGVYLSIEHSSGKVKAFCAAENFNEAAEKLKPFDPANIGERWYETDLSAYHAQGAVQIGEVFKESFRIIN